QDFYAHTNYIALWVQERLRDAMPIDPSNCDHAGLDPDILSHPSLRVAEWQTWRDPFYYVPGVGHILRRVWLPDGSHESINLDSPSKGAHFDLAVLMARRRTITEYARAVAVIREVGGLHAIMRFHGVAGFAPNGIAARA